MITPYALLENRWATFTGSQYAVACNSGTSALHLALLALGVGHGDEVIVPDFTMAAVGFAVSYCGATPIFADVEENTYGLDAASVEKHITQRTRAIIVVHTYGRLADTEKLFALARKHDLLIIEDACEAQGAVCQSKADATCYSFYKNKIIAAEEGGMVTTDDAKIAERMNYLKNMAFGPTHNYYHEAIGYNYRMPESQAHLALGSLDEYPVNKAARQQIETWYRMLLHDQRPFRDAVWFYEYAPRDVQAALHVDKRIRCAFKPLSTFPMYGGSDGMEVQNIVSVRLSQSLVLLPVSPELTQDTIVTITQGLLL